MFKLKLKDGVAVSTLEELRENFDLEKVVYYFTTGELLTWLEDRFYDDEADAISEIDGKGDDFLAEKICAALNVECDDNLEFTRRVREKKAILTEKTDDESIIDNAASTALNQEDLATLIQMNYKTIYLCGEQFNVPIRISDKKYIGILGTPKIKIRAKAQDELDAKNISFENVQLPWQKAAPIEELKDLAEKIFQTEGKWPIVKLVDEERNLIVAVSAFDKLSKVEKATALRMVCQGKYTEQQIAYLQVTEDLSSGFAFTTDSFCTGGGVGNNLIPYNKIKTAWVEAGLICLAEKLIAFAYYDCIRSYKNMPSGTRIWIYNYEACKKLFSKVDYDKVAKFLEVAKNF